MLYFSFVFGLQKELSQCNSKPQIKMLLEHLENKCDGKTLADLMRIPASRVRNSYNKNCNYCLPFYIAIWICILFESIFGRKD